MAFQRWKDAERLAGPRKVVMMTKGDILYNRISVSEKSYIQNKRGSVITRALAVREWDCDDFYFPSILDLAEFL